MSAILESLFDYDDYRKFLQAYFDEQKRLKPVFSHRFFASKAGFSSSSYCLNVIRGRFNLTLKSIEKLALAMDFSEVQKQYFTALVYYNQAQQAEERDLAWSQILQVRHQLEFTHITLKQQDYFSKWYYPVLRELVVHVDWDGDYMKLARFLDPAISTEEARTAVKNLEDWDLVRRLPSGRYEITSLMLDATKVPPIFLRQIRREYIQHAIGSIESKKKEERFSAFTTLSMTEESYIYAVDVLEEARKKIMKRVAGDKDVDKVYEMMIVLYPMSKSMEKREI